MQRRILLLFLVFFSPLTHAVSATPWLTGPILAPAGHTIPCGHTNFEMYALDIYTRGHFDEFGSLTPTPLFRTFVANPILTHGFTDWMDIQWAAPYVYNTTQGQSYHRLGDVSAAVGFQLLEQKKSWWKPDLRFVVQETFPTGQFEHLNPDEIGIDSTGIGSYQTQLGLNFQRLNQFGCHFLRTRLSLNYVYFGPVHIHGLSSFGGTVHTDGIINASNEFDAVLAFEFTMTQHWVLVMEGYVSQGNASRFTGVANLTNISAPPVAIGSNDFFEAALTPAIEYNFTSNVGIIGGVWFPVNSRSASNFTTYVLALNAYW